MVVAVVVAVVVVVERLLLYCGWYILIIERSRLRGRDSFGLALPTEDTAATCHVCLTA